MSRRDGTRLVRAVLRARHLVVCLLVAAYATHAGAGTFRVFGPERFERSTGKPRTIVRSFSVPNAFAPYFLHVLNGSSAGAYSAGTGAASASSAVISLNAETVFGPGEFRRGSPVLHTPVFPTAENELAVELRGQPGAALIVEVYGIDDLPPEIHARLDPLPNTSGWNASDVTVFFSCEDATSGVTSCPAPVTVSAEGEQVITGTARDRAGNVATTTVVVRIDRTPPRIVETRAPEANAYGWNRTDVVVGFTCADDLSGVDACSGPSFISTEGGKDVVGSAADVAGNTAVVVAQVRLDRTAPLIVESRTPPPNANDWNNSDVSIAYHCSDELSGIATCPTTSLVSSEGDGQVVTRSAEDRAGNAAVATTVVRIDRTPPRITPAPHPPPNAAGWNSSDVSVSFACADTLSGVASCSAPSTLSSETAGTEVRGSAVDIAGNAAVVSRVLRIDRTPPAVLRRWPPVDDFATDLAAANVEGTVHDALSGVSGAVVSGPFGVADASIPEFAVRAELRTDVQPGSTSRANDLEIVVTDAAGNVARQPFRVTYTVSAHLLATDPHLTEIRDGIRTAVDRALVQFAPGIGRATIDNLVGQHGGRIAGYLPTTNTALVVLGTRTLPALDGSLDAIRAAREVADARPVVFFKPTAFDNDAPGSPLGDAYHTIQLSRAANMIIGEGHTLVPAGVAIIDSGLDRRFGQAGELDGVHLLDLCEPVPRYVDGPVADVTAHGTMLAGVIAGANNGFGNNGILAGLPANFTVTVLRTRCGEDGDELDGALVTLALELIVTGELLLARTHAVNMSFGLGSEHPAGKRWLADYFAPFVNSVGGRDVVWVASAGNNDRETACEGYLLYPAGLACDYANVVSVGGYEPLSGARAWKSNYGPAVTVYAPAFMGTVWDWGQYTYQYLGTSGAAAIVTGAVALLRSARPQTPWEVRQSLQAAARMLPFGLPPGGVDVYELLLIGALPPLSHATYTGASGGGREFHSTAEDTPGLRGFLLDFDSEDHHVGSIAAGFLQPPFTSIAFAELSDSNGDDNYRWTIDSQELPRGTVYATVDGSGHCSDDRLIAPSGAGVPVLVGFEVTSAGDHELNRLAISLFRFDVSGKLAVHVWYADELGCDPFNYSLTYALVPRDRVRTTGAVAGDDSGGSASGPIDATNPVLQGFDLQFKNGDNHLDRIGVRLEAGKATVYLDDKNDDDDFHWRVDWIDVR